MHLKRHIFAFFSIIAGLIIMPPNTINAYMISPSIQTNLLDKYTSMAELKENEKKNKDWDTHSSNRYSEVISMSIHGGGIEIGTTQIAKLVAETGNFDFYSFEGGKTK